LFGNSSAYGEINYKFGLESINITEVKRSIQDECCLSSRSSPVKLGAEPRSIIMDLSSAQAALAGLR